MRKLLSVFLLFVAIPSWGAISNTPVQTAGDTGFAQTVLLDSSDSWSTPTSGNLLVCHTSVRPTGTEDVQISLTGAGTWTEEQSYEGTASGSAKGAVFWKESDGTETAITGDGGSASINNISIVCAEYSSTDLDISAAAASNEDVSNVSSSVTSQGTGSASNTVADALVLVGLSVKIASRWDGTGPSISGYTIDVKQPAGAGSNALTAIASKVVSSTASQSGTWTTTDTGSNAYGTILIFDGVSGSTTTWTDETVDIGTQDMVGTLDVAFSAAADECEMANGDQIPVTSGGSTTGGTCDVTKAMFLSGGVLSNTRIASATTAFLRNTTETSTADNMTFNSPDNGTTEHFGTSTCANPGCDNDSLYENADFLTEYAAFASGDDVWVTVQSGACDFDPTTGIFECTSLPASGYVRVYDVTATDWLTESSWSIDSPDGSCGHAISLTPTVRPIAYSPVKPVSC